MAREDGIAFINQSHCLHCAAACKYVPKMPLNGDSEKSQNSRKTIKLDVWLR